MYVYRHTEHAGRNGCETDLFTVGFYSPGGQWDAESDHESKDAAAARVHYLNGGAALPAVSEPGSG